MNRPDFAYATARFMAQYGCRLDEELVFLLGCPLFLAARRPGSGAGAGLWFETENPCRFEYIAAAFGSPYQLRTIDGPNALAWVKGRMERGEPLLLDLPEALLLEGANEESGRRLCAYASGTGEIALSFGPSRHRTMPLGALADAMLRRGDVNAVMFYAPLQPLPEAYLREMVRQSLVKQHSLLRSCPYGPAEVGIASLRESLRRDAADPLAVERHRRLLASLGSGSFAEGSPTLGRRYYAHALRTAAPRCGTVLLDAAEAFSANAAAWSAIVGRTAADGLTAEGIAEIYDAMWEAEMTLLETLPPFATAGVWS